MNTILKQARKIVIPSRKQQKEKIKAARIAFELVRKQIGKYQEITSIEFGGSYAKGTWLPKKADVDIFVKFNKNTSEKQFVEIGKKIGFDALKKYHPYVRYSEHPYVEAEINDTKVNVVPCYDVEKGKWKSAADRSPYHTKFMLETLTGPMKDEVRLLKTFILANDIYGSEIAKQGISGYVTEVLICKFESFENAVSVLANFKKNQTIGKSQKTFDTSMTIIDPIDSNRNLGTAISTENVGKLILVCRAFLSKPSISFFKTKKVSSSSKKNFENCFVIEFNFKPRSPDIIWGQLKRVLSTFSVQLGIEGFKVLRKSAIVNDKSKAELLFLLQSVRIDENFVRFGPDFFDQDNLKKFVATNLKKSKTLWINSDSRILSLQKRKYTDARVFLQHLIKNDFEKSGIPKGLKLDFKKGFKIIPGAKIKNKSIKEAIIKLVSNDEVFLYSSK